MGALQVDAEVQGLGFRDEGQTAWDWGFADLRGLGFGGLGV